MWVNFAKYQGAGNDFVIIDNRKKLLNAQNFDAKLVAYLCHRRFGIGADGLMLVQNSAEYDFKMVYYNSDGNESSMCGNGGRCITAFAQRIGVFTGEQTQFIAVDGVHNAKIDGDWVSLQMQDVKFVEVGEDFYFLNTGSPHYVTFVEGIDTYDVYNKGKEIRYMPRFKQGTNVNFVSLRENALKVRTYERGVEDETYACGTGCTAAAIAAFLRLGGKRTDFNITTKGGLLKVNFEGNLEKGFSNVWLEGGAKFVFEGEIEI